MPTNFPEHPRTQNCLVFSIAIIIVVLLSHGLQAQQPPEHNSTAEASRDNKAFSPIEDSLASPRETMFTFLEAQSPALHGRPDALARAINTLDLSLVENRQSTDIINQLIGILNRIGEVTKTQLPDADEVIANGWRRFKYFPTASHSWIWTHLGHGPDGEIILEEIQGKWRFSASTIAGLDTLYRSMIDLPLTYTPQEEPDELIGLFGATFQKTRWWQWFALFLGILLGLVAGKLVAALLNNTSAQLQRNGRETQGMALKDISNPIGLTLLTFGLMVGLQFPHLDPGLQAFVGKIIQFLFILSLGWVLFNLVDVVELALQKLTAKTETQIDDMMVPLIRKSLRIFLVIVFSLFVAQNVFGLNITGWLAGLGIAGLAVSLAAQDSVKNLFGSVTVVLDKTFLVGDFIRFDGEVGTVEEIGFRSTRIRLLSGHLVTVPNMKFIDNKVENIAARPYIRRQMDVTITYDTPPNKINEAVQIVKDILHTHEVVKDGRFDMDNNPPRVAFNELNADSLNIRAYYWYQMANDPDRGFFTYLQHAQLINTMLFQRFAEAGIEFAFPTQTLFLAGDPARKLAIEAQINKNGDETPRAYT